MSMKYNVLDVKVIRRHKGDFGRKTELFYRVWVNGEYGDDELLLPAHKFSQKPHIGDTLQSVGTIMEQRVWHTVAWNVQRKK